MDNSKSERTKGNLRELYKEYKRQKSKVKQREYQKEYQRTHKPSKEKTKLKNQKWQDKNREKTREYTRNRRALKINAIGIITPEEWKDLCNKYDNKCLCCGKSGVKLTQDHIVPLKLGGANIIDNVQPLCKSCNSKKNIKIIDYRALSNS